eukprot:3683512-Rhodomonas_salina.1
MWFRTSYPLPYYPPIQPGSRSVKSRDVRRHETSGNPSPSPNPSEHAIPPSAAAAPDALTTLLHGATELPLPTDNGCGDDFADERSDGEGN